MSYKDALADLFRRNRRGIKPGLEATQDLAAAMNVNLNTLPMVLVAGTNGKGSVSSLIAHFCTEAGFKTGHYSSPHLLRFTERIKVDGIEISQEDVVSIWESIGLVEPSLDQPPSFFEICTVMAHQYFQSQRCDIVIFEVGLGGRLDATNAAEPSISVITNIGFDHEHILGNTLEAISFEKCGIARSGIPCIIGHQTNAEVPSIVEAAITKRGGIPTWAACLSSGAHDLTFMDHNLSTAQAAFRAVLKLMNTTELVLTVPSTDGWNWPGRLEHHHSPSRAHILLDGAHNAQALTALADAMKNDERFRGRRTLVLYSCVNSREPAKLIPLLRAITENIFFAPSTVDRSLTRQDFESMSSARNVFDSVEMGLEALVKSANAQDLIVVTGSLFAVADAKAWLTGEPRDPPIQG